MRRQKRNVPKCRIVGNAFYQIWHLSAVMFYFTAEGDILYRLPNRMETSQLFRSVLCV